MRNSLLRGAHAHRVVEELAHRCFQAADLSAFVAGAGNVDEERHGDDGENDRPFIIQRLVEQILAERERLFVAHNIEHKRHNDDRDHMRDLDADKGAELEHEGLVRKHPDHEHSTDPADETEQQHLPDGLRQREILLRRQEQETRKNREFDHARQRHELHRQRLIEHIHAQPAHQREHKASQRDAAEADLHEHQHKASANAQPDDQPHSRRISSAGISCTSPPTLKPLSCRSVLMALR